MANKRITSLHWDDFLTQIENATGLTVDSVSRYSGPAKWIVLFDSDGNEYEGEVERYSDGTFEIRTDNINATGLNFHGGVRRYDARGKQTGGYIMRYENRRNYSAARHGRYAARRKIAEEIDREQFISGPLTDVLRATRAGIDYLYFNPVGRYGGASAVIVYDNGYEREVNIEADSNLAIIEDVLREVLMH